VKMLLDGGADILLQSQDGSTAVHRAAEECVPEILEMLLDATANVDARNRNNATALHLAARTGEPVTVKALLDAKADVSAQTTEGWTALHFAAVNGYSAIVRMLLDAEADVAVQDKDGQTASDWAAWNGHSTVVKMLHNEKALLQQELGKNLYHAASKGNYEGAIEKEQTPARSVAITSGLETSGNGSLRSGGNPDCSSTTCTVLTGHMGEVWDLQFSHDGNRLASSSADTCVIIWDTEVGYLSNLN